MLAGAGRSGWRRRRTEDVAAKRGRWQLDPGPRLRASCRSRKASLERICGGETTTNRATHSGRAPNPRRLFNTPRTGAYLRALRELRADGELADARDRGPKASWRSARTQAGWSPQPQNRLYPHDLDLPPPPGKLERDRGEVEVVAHNKEALTIYRRLCDASVVARYRDDTPPACSV